MNKFMKTLAILFVLISTTSTALAGNAPARPLGYTLGKSTYDEVKRDLSAKTTVRDNGINKYTHGPMLAADGDLDLENLKEADLIFGQDKRLAAVLLTFNKLPLDANFDPLFQLLASKYTLVEKHIPFVGNKTAKFRQGDVLIDLESVHLSFTIQVVYRTTAFDQLYKKQNQLEQKQQSGQQRNNL